MKRNAAIELIRSIEPAIRALGASALYLFGSTARDEARPLSDIDVFIDRDATKKLGLIELGELEHLLEATLGTKVDLATRDALHPVLKPEIERTAIRVL